MAPPLALGPAECQTNPGPIVGYVKMRDFVENPQISCLDILKTDGC